MVPRLWILSLALVSLVQSLFDILLGMSITFGQVNNFCLSLHHHDGE
jgi:hypothetical protein